MFSIAEVKEGHIADKNLPYIVTKSLLAHVFPKATVGLLQLTSALASP